MSARKTIEDFPKFVIATVRRGETWTTGYTRFDLAGRFDRLIENMDPHWFWLLGEGRECYCATLQELNPHDLQAVLSCDGKEEPKVAGRKFVYLSSRWQAYHVWMVVDRDWGWKETRFEATDAVDEDYEAQDASNVEGRNVRVWTKREPAEERNGSSRHYPAVSQTLPPSSKPRLVQGGWSYEYCTLCRNHINAGDSAYCDARCNWMCDACYKRYVVPVDLAFVDEL